MKHKLSILLLITMMTSTAVLAETRFSKNSVTESVYGIESSIATKGTKSDAEVFSLSEIENGFNMFFLEQGKNLSFSLDNIFDYKKRTLVDSSLDLEIERLNDGFKVNTTILSKLSNILPTLEVEMPDNWNLDYARSKTGEIINGSLAFYDDNGNPVASTGLPRAIDANGNEVEAKFTINNNDIILDIDTSNVTYPIETSYGVYAANSSRDVTDYFKYCGFNIVREGSLTLGPRYFDEGSVISTTNAWNAVVNLFYKVSMYWTDNLDGMHDQYWCHANFAKTKNEWNLEPYRPNVGYNATVAAHCNP